jgi:hypothetical protein
MMLDRTILESQRGAPAGPGRPESRGFVFEDYFHGAVRGRGIVQDRFGRLRAAFLVDMQGYWRGADFVLDELFRFRDGKTQRRTWRVTRGAGGRYWVAADDVVGIGQGIGDGTQIRWRYRLRVPIGRLRMAYAFDDRMFLMEDGSILDVSDMSKFGIRCARLVLSLKRRA